jgi:DNA repair exonuclease SbcCD nuclease subunit
MRIEKSEYVKINFVWSTDWHLSAIPPGQRGDDYESVILEKLDFIRDLTEKVKGFALCGGDVFHVKKAHHPANSLSLLVRTLRTLRKFPMGRVYGAVGNHDLAWGERMDSLSGQPLGLLIASGAYADLTEECLMVSSQFASLKVQVQSFPYDHGQETLHRIKASHRHGDANYFVGIVHAYGQPGGPSDYFGERVIGYDELAGSDFDFLLWGHDHGRQETKKVGNTTHVHLGSLARAAFDSDQAERPVSVAVLSFSEQGPKYKEIALPVKPLAEAFVTADREVRHIDKSEEVKQFLTQMEVAVGGVETSDPGEVLRELCPKEDIRLLMLVKELCGL